MPNDRSDLDRHDRARPDRWAPAAPSSASARPASADAMLCDRCATEMFRMHAVWRCPACGYKTDCCGW
jgi:hypothetical protein